MGFGGFGRPFGQGGFGRPGRHLGGRPGRGPQQRPGGPNRPNKEQSRPNNGPNKPGKGPNKPGKGPNRPLRPQRPNKPLVSNEIVESPEYQDDDGPALEYSDEVEDSTVVISSEFSDEKK